MVPGKQTLLPTLALQKHPVLVMFKRLLEVVRQLQQFTSGLKSKPALRGLCRTGRGWGSA